MRYNFTLLIKKDNVYILLGNEITRRCLHNVWYRMFLNLLPTNPLGQMACEEVTGFVLKKKLVSEKFSS